ncbi:PAS domain-containing sensor histidine kinase [Bacteroidota bacterium]
MRKLKNILFTRFNILVLLQILVLAIIPFVFWLIQNDTYLSNTRIILILLWFGQIIFLFYFINSKEEKFIDALRILKNETGYHDFKRLFRHNVNPKFIEEIQELVEAFRITRLEKEKDLSFFRMVIQNLPIGVLTYQKNGQVQIANKEIESLIGIRDNQNINALNESSKSISSIINTISESKSQTNKILFDGEIKYLFSRCSKFIIENEEYNVVSIQDIKEEVHRLENLTLKRMVRILSHEMINSLNPITFLSLGLINNFESESVTLKAMNPEDHKKLISGLHTIKKRSEGLTEFITAYKEFIHIPQPKWDKFLIMNLISQVNSFFKHEFENLGINCILKPEKSSIEIKSDYTLLMQVLINLVKNSIQALEGINNAKIEILFKQDESNVYVDVQDNGVGISEENLPEVFSTFFTTKNNGSGLGLSFSKQVMNILGGNISVESYKEKTIFRLKLPKMTENPTTNLS